MSYTKNYIGKGKKVANLDIVQVVVHMDNAEPFIFEKDGKRYLKFELAALKQPDNYGKTHTAYISTREVEPAQAEEPKPKRSRRKKAEA